MDTLQHRQQLMISESTSYAKHAINRYNKRLLAVLALFALFADSYPLSASIGRQVQAYIRFLSLN